MELPKRKQNRLEDYDYSKSGTYFITVCVQDRKPILSHISANADSIYPPRMQLSFIGKIVENAIQAIPEHYQNISVDHYVIMPNHVHMLVRIEDDGGRAMCQE